MIRRALHQSLRPSNLTLCVVLGVATLGSSCGPAAIGAALSSGGGGGGGGAGSVGPVLLSSSPLDNATDVSTSASVSATFVRDLDASTVTLASFFVTLDGVMVATPPPTTNGNVATLIAPPEGWDLAAKYRVEVKAGIEDSSDQVLVTTPFSWVFTIRDGAFAAALTVPTTALPPSVVSLNAADELDKWEAFFTDDNGIVAVASLSASGAWQATAQEIVSTSPLDTFEAELASTGEGVAILSKVSNQEVRVSSTDVVGWKTAQKIAPGSNGNGQLPQVAAAVSSGACQKHAVWIKRDDPDQVLYDPTPDPDLNGNQPSLISTDVQSPGDSILELDLAVRDDLVVAVYARDKPPTQIDLLATFDSPTQSWLSNPAPAPVAIRTTTSMSNLRLAMGGVGVLLWIEGAVVMVSTFDSTSDAPTFGGSEPLSSGSSAMRAEIVVGKNFGFASWIENQAGQERWLLRRYDIHATPPVWEPAVTINPGFPGLVLNASVTFDRNDNALLVWQQSDGQLNVDVVFWRRLLAIGGLQSDPPKDVFSSLVNSNRMTGPRASLLSNGRGVVVARSEFDNSFKFALFQ